MTLYLKVEPCVQSGILPHPVLCTLLFPPCDDLSVVTSVSVLKLVYLPKSRLYFPVSTVER